MTIGIPFDLSFQNSNVTDPAQTLDELIEGCQVPVFDVGLELQAGDWVYEYHGEVDFIPKVWNVTDESNGVYNLNDVLMKDCKLVKVVGKSGVGITTHQRPKEPEEYSCFDTDMDYANWQCRYVKVSAATACGWVTKVWTEGNVKMSICWDHCANNYKWALIDNRVGSNCAAAYFTIQRSSKYTSSNDMKTRIISWSPGYGLSRTNVPVIRSMVERNKFFYLRTNVNAPIEYNTWTTGSAFQYSYMDIDSPADVDGFKQKRRVQAHNPFDGKNYTQTIFNTGEDGYARWDVMSPQWIDSIALGKLICDTIDFIISDENGNKLFELNNYPVDNRVAPNRNEKYEDTIVLYSDKSYPPTSIITVILHGAKIRLGELIGASKLDAGFTKVAFKNKMRDFSPKEQDQWGNWYYKDGVRVHVHSGTVEYEVVSYDTLTRLMMLIGGQKVVINSSDSTENEVPDSYNIFSATMLIARFTSFELATNEKNKRIGDRATYNFTVEELI